MNIFIKLLNHVDTREEYSVDGSIQSTSNLICNASGSFFFDLKSCTTIQTLGASVIGFTVVIYNIYIVLCFLQ